MTDDIPPYGEPPVQAKETVADVVGRLKDGDVCEFTFRALRRGGVFDFGDASCLPPQLERHISSIEILPPAAKPLTVGEVVIWGNEEYEVVLIENDEVVLRGKSGLDLATLDYLDRPCGTPIAESE